MKNFKIFEEFKNDNFKKWFGKSKIKNSDGTPKIMYHGTTYDFDTFQKGNIYLSFEPEYASKYALQRNFSAFSKSDYKSIEQKSVIPLYVRCEKPFDTRIPECKKIFNTEYLYKYGNGTPLNNGLLDWTDAEDFSVFLEENNYDYDGIVLMDSHQNISLCVFDSNQVKSATGNNGNYSLKSNNITEKITETKNITISIVTEVDTEPKEITLEYLSVEDKGYYLAYLLSHTKRNLIELDETICKPKYIEKFKESGKTRLWFSYPKGKSYSQYSFPTNCSIINVEDF